MLVTPNLVLRFVLELCGLVAAGTWGFTFLDNWPARIAVGLGIPAAMAAAWGVFRIPNDGGPPVVEVAPLVRLLIEVAYFALAVALLWQAGYPRLAPAFAVLILIHYAVAYPRTLALIANRQPGG
jgi:Protein of unknown function (DUF2568)